MGKIQKQGIANTFWNYLGIGAGGIYTIFIIPKAFDSHPEYWGLIQFLVYYVQVLLPLAQLGVPNAVIRFFSKIDASRLPSFYFFNLLIVVAMTTLFSVIFYLFGDGLAATADKELYQRYYLFFIPLMVGASLFETFSAFSRAALRTSMPVFLKETFSKLWTLLILTLFSLDLFSFDVFIVLYALIYLLQFIVILIRITSLADFSFKSGFDFFNSPIAKQMYPYMLLTMFGTSTALWATKIDVLMIGYLINYEQVAYYTIALYIATLIVVPFRSMSSVATPMVAGFWSAGDLKSINVVYKKVAEVSLITGSFIFLVIWMNIDWLMHILGPKFGTTKWVFLFLGVAKLIDVASSINGGIILTSKHYKIDLLFQVLLITLTVILNLWLIPIYGLRGAALASVFSVLVYNVGKILFLMIKVHIFPFAISSIWSILLFSSCFGLSFIIPQLSNYWVHAGVTLAFLATVYTVSIVWLGISKALKLEFVKVLKYL